MVVKSFVASGLARDGTPDEIGKKILVLGGGGDKKKWVKKIETAFV